MSFVRLLFTAPLQEEIAFRWASRLARLLGNQAMELRPDCTLLQMLKWAAKGGCDSMDFVVVFEPELGMEFAEFLDDPDHVTFRDMVEHCAKRLGEGAA